MSWLKFFADVIKYAPSPIKHEGVQGNIHPNENGLLVWHVSIVKQHDSQKNKLIKFLEQHVGTGPITTYEGGSVLKVLHARRQLTQEEEDQVSDDVKNLII